MRQLFVDSFYYIALINPRDAYHDHAKTTALDLADCRFWTTDLALTEVANAMAHPRLRHQAAMYLRAIEQASDTTIIRLTSELFDRALSFYAQHDDKEWSLTDCLSFVVMREHGLTEALTGDHHFTQAGYRPLLQRMT